MLNAVSKWELFLLSLELKWSAKSGTLDFDHNVTSVNVDRFTKFLHRQTH